MVAATVPRPGVLVYYLNLKPCVFPGVGTLCQHAHHISKRFLKVPSRGRSKCTCDRLATGCRTCCKLPLAPMSLLCLELPWKSRHSKTSSTEHLFVKDRSTATAWQRNITTSSSLKEFLNHGFMSCWGPGAANPHPPTAGY